MTSKAAELAIDQAALKRMAAAFVAARSEAGDARGMAGVMDVYEEQVQAPLKNAVAGSLVQAMLIQIQKLKVSYLH